MSIKLPLYRQAKDNTCALACLRMVLAAYGTDIEESTLEGQAHLEPDGTEIGELARLTQQFGLVAEIQALTVEQLRLALAEGHLVMVYIDRAVFGLTPAQRARHTLRAAKLHVVIPTHVTAGSVTYHDPLPPRITRKSVRLFRAAFERLGGHSIVCSKRENQQPTAQDQPPRPHAPP